MKEDNFINLIKDILPESSDYIGDDTAYVQEKDLILTQDTLIEDVHFRSSTINPFDLGYKSVAVNLSDIAASGGISKFILISLSMPKNIDDSFIIEFYKGVKFICNKFNTIVVGGDITGALKITVSITAIGYGNGLTPAKRNNAQVDDIVITTGEFGSSRAGLWILENNLKNNNLIEKIPNEIAQKFIKAHTTPYPQLETGRKILELSDKPLAMMDTSDGLADALYKISLQSNVSMEIDYNSIPFDKDLKSIADIAHENIFNWIFFGGEDYQLITTVSKNCLEKLLQEQIKIKPIGKVIPSDNTPSVYVKFEDKTAIINSETLNQNVFNHFK